MEFVNLIVNVIGFVVLACYIWLLKGQIKSQKDILDSQNETIKSMKIYVDIFQPEKIHEFVKMREMTFEDKRNKEIEIIRSEMEEKLKKRGDVINFAIDEISFLYRITFNLAFYVNHESRKEAFERLPNSASKANLIKTIETVPYYGDLYRNALAEAFSKYKREHSLEG